MTRARLTGLATALICTGALALPAMADPGQGAGTSAPAGIATSTIDSGVAKGANGNIAVNQTAGANNAQSNQAVIVQGGATLGIGVLGSQQMSLGPALAGAAKSSIDGTAFSGVAGLTQVNQSSGSGNLQHNAAVIVGGVVSGVEIASDTALSGAISRGGWTGHPGISEQYREVSISPEAFRNAAGIVQVNQSAGVGNIASNVFVLRPPAGTSF